MKEQPTLAAWFGYYFIMGEKGSSPGYVPWYVRPRGAKWFAICLMHYVKHPVGLARRAMKRKQ